MFGTKVERACRVRRVPILWRFLARVRVSFITAVVHSIVVADGPVGFGQLHDICRCAQGLDVFEFRKDSKYSEVEKIQRGCSVDLTEQDIPACFRGVCITCLIWGCLQGAR